MNEDCQEMARYINKPRCWSMNKYQCHRCPDRITCAEKEV